MKKALLASMMVLALEGCAPTPEYIEKSAQDCSNETGIKTNQPSVKIIECIQDRVNQAYADGTFTEMQAEFNQHYNYKAMLAEEFEKGKISEYEYRVMEDQYVNTINSQREAQQAQNRAMMGALGAQLLQPPQANPNQFNCTSHAMGQYVNTNCY